MLALRISWTSCCVLTAALVVSADDGRVPSTETRFAPDEVRATATDTFLRMRILAAVLDIGAAEGLPFPKPASGIVPAAWLRAHIDPRHRRHLGSGRDAWGHSIRYWSDGRNYMLLSLGSDEEPQFDYSHDVPFAQIPRGTTGPDPTSDLLVVNGLAWRGPASRTEMLVRSAGDVRSIGTAVESYGVDYNAYPGPIVPIAPVEAIERDLAPIYIRALPRVDPWENPYLFWSDATSYAIVGLGTDGAADHDYTAWGRKEFQAIRSEASPASGSDIVFVDGRLVRWPLAGFP